MWVMVIGRFRESDSSWDFLQPSSSGLRFAALETAALFKDTNSAPYEAARDEVLRAITPNPGVPASFNWFLKQIEVDDATRCEDS